MARISLTQYNEAKAIVGEYEKQQAELTKLMGELKTTFPIGAHVVSKLNPAVRGRIIGYGSWDGIPSLKLESNTGQRNKCLVTNAVIV